MNDPGQRFEARRSSRRRSAFDNNYYKGIGVGAASPQHLCVCILVCIFILLFLFALVPPPPPCTPPPPHPPRAHTHTHTPHRRRPRPSSPVRRRFSRLWGPHPHRPSLNLNLLIALIIVVIRPQPPSLGTPGGPWDPGGAENAKSTLDLGKKKKRKRNSNADRGLGTPPNKRFLLFRGVTFANASKIGSPGGGGSGKDGCASKERSDADD